MMKRMPLLVLISFILVLCLIFTSFGGEVAAQGSEEAETIQVPDQRENFFLMLVQLFFYTALVIALIILFTRFLAKRRQLWQEHSLFQNLGGAPLGPNKSVQLVKLGEKIYVLGVGEEITLLDIIDDPDEVRQLEAADKGAPKEGLIPSLRGRWTVGQGAKQEEKGEFNFAAVLEESLERQRKARQKQLSRLPEPEQQNERGEDR